jgi:integrase/recombinase XerD
MAVADFDDEGPSLYTHDGQRKYLNRAERKRVLKVLRHLDRGRALCGMLLFWTGGRISEILGVRANSFQLDRSVVALRTLKRRRLHVREIPISPELTVLFDRHFKLRKLQKNPATANQRLWPFHRVTAWRFIKQRMLEAGIVGRAACPRGMRHGFGVGTLQAGVPLSLVQRWMGHARMSTTAIYTEVSGKEEAAFAAQFWEDGDLSAGSSPRPANDVG